MRETLGHLMVLYIGAASSLDKPQPLGKFWCLHSHLDLLHPSVHILHSVLSLYTLNLCQGIAPGSTVLSYPGCLLLQQAIAITLAAKPRLTSKGSRVGICPSSLVCPEHFSTSLISLFAFLSLYLVTSIMHMETNFVCAAAASESQKHEAASRNKNLKSLFPCLFSLPLINLRSCMVVTFCTSFAIARQGQKHARMQGCVRLSNVPCTKHGWSFIE